MLPHKHYPKVINTELKQIEFEIWKLRRKIKDVDDSYKAEYKELVGVLASKLEQAKSKLKILANADEGEWDSVKADLDETNHALKKMLSFALSQIDDLSKRELRQDIK